MQETWVRFLGWEDPLGKGKATHSSILAWTIPWTVACQAPLSMEISRQEFWSGLPFHSPGDFPNRRIEPMSPALRGRFFTSWDTREAWVYLTSTQFYIQIHLASQGCCKWQRIRLLMQNTQETRIWSLDWKEPLKKEMAIHSSISCLENSMDRGAWQSMGSQTKQRITESSASWPRSLTSFSWTYIFSKKKKKTLKQIQINQKDLVQKL